MKEKLFKRKSQLPESELIMHNNKINRMRSNGIWFTDQELQESCNLYNFPIVIFSIQNKMAFFDTLFLPMGDDSSSDSDDEKPPLYLFLHDHHFTVLVHRSQ